MAARSLDTTDRGVQGVRGTAGSGVRADERDVRYRIDVIGPNVLDVVTHAGGWLFDRVMAGWDVTVLVADHPNDRPLQILGTQTLDLEYALASLDRRPPPQTLAVAADLFADDPRVRQMVRQALDHGLTEVGLWGQTWPAELKDSVDSEHYQLSAAARVFKAQALAAAGAPDASAGVTETFRSTSMAGPFVAADPVPAS
jgi:hypothetical protein